MSTFTRVVPFAFVLALASGVWAEDQQPKGGVSRDLEAQFKALDRDGDGFVSQAELKPNQSLAAGFKDADKNGDGKLDLSEFQSLQASASTDRSLGSAPPSGAAGSTGTAK